MLLRLKVLLNNTPRSPMTKLTRGKEQHIYNYFQEPHHKDHEKAYPLILLNSIDSCLLFSGLKQNLVTCWSKTEKEIGRTVLCIFHPWLLTI